MLSATAIPKAAIPAPVSTISAARAAIFAGAGLANLNLAVVEGVAVELADRLRGFFWRIHFDEAKAFGAPCLPIRDDSGICHHAHLLKQGAQFFFCHTVGQIADI